MIGDTGIPLIDFSRMKLDSIIERRYLAKLQSHQININAARQQLENYTGIRNVGMGLPRSNCKKYKPNKLLLLESVI